MIKEQQIRGIVEHRKIIEERIGTEKKRVVEENVPLTTGHVTAGSAKIEREVGEKELTGKEKIFGREGVVGKESRETVEEKAMQLPIERRVLDTYDVEGVVETLRQIEEIETVEIRRIIEERQPLEKPILDEEIIKKYHSKKYIK